MKSNSYLGLLFGGLAAVIFTTTTALADNVPDDNDGGKWNPTEVLGPLSDQAEVEPNDTPALANPFACGDVLRPASIGVPNDRDFITFTTAAGTIIQFGTDADGATGQVGDTFIDLIASDGTTVLASSDDEGPGLYSLLTYTATYTGTYYGRIRAFSATAVGGYRAFVACFAPVPLVCELSNYKSSVQTFPTPVPIPDNVPAGVLVGTLTPADDLTSFLDVVLAIKMSHTFVGDLIATVSYDLECDGTVEASTNFLCRPGRATCVGGTGFGCASNMSCNNTYYFSDAGAAEIGLPPQGCGTTATVLPGGCFKPNSTGSPMSVFDGYRKGGCFTLRMSDNVAVDVGTVCEWGVYSLNTPPTPTQNASWGRIKTLYR